ncbi:MAG: YceD family protein [Trueperaceae bacterium]
MSTRNEDASNSNSSSAGAILNAVLNLASLLRHDLSTGGEVEGQGDFMPQPSWHSSEVRFEKPLEYDLRVRSAGGDDFIVQGRVTGEVIMPCRHCLEGVAVPSRSDFLYPMKYRPGKPELEMVFEDEEDEVLMFGRPEVDFAEMITEIFSVDLPLAVECPEGVSCERLSERYAERAAKTTPSPFASLEDFDVESKE